MEKTTYKFTAYVEVYNRSLQRSVKYFAGVDSAEMALAWINEMSQSGSVDCTVPLISFGFYETKNDK